MIAKLGHRIAIIGPTCSGKSTLAIELGRQLSLPIYHLDKIKWLGAGVAMDESAFESAVRSHAAANRWIIEGAYAGALPWLLERAEQVIYLDYSRTLCLGRVFKRGIAEHLGTLQLGNNNHHKHTLTWSTFSWVLSHYPREKKPRIDKILKETRVPVFWIRSPRQLRRFLA